MSLWECGVKGGIQEAHPAPEVWLLFACHKMENPSATTSFLFPAKNK